MRPPLEKALLVSCVTDDRVPVQLNPTEYTVNKDVNYAQVGVPGLSGPIVQFVHGNLETLEMELFLDTYEEHREGSRVLNRAGEDVRNLSRRVTDLMAIDPTTHAPPMVLFLWGSLSFTCVLARASQRFVMFLPDGTPVRLRMQVTFNKLTNLELEAREVKRETADFSELYVVREGETLSSIAERTYGDPALWRPIALTNDVEDPREVPVGTRLLVPRLPFQDPASGEVFQ